MQLNPVEVVRCFPEIDPAVIVNPRVSGGSRQFWINPLAGQSKMYVRTMIGFDLDTVYLVRGVTPHAADWPETWLSWRQNQNVFLVGCDPSDASVALISQHLPGWLDMEFVRRFVQDQRSVAFDDLPPGRCGRYVLDDIVTVNQRNALSRAQSRMFPLNEIEFVPDVTLLYTNKQSRFGGRPVSLWSDDEIVLSKDCWYADGEINLTRDAANLVSVAIYQKSWRETGRWQQLLQVSAVQRETLDSKSSQGASLAGNWKADKELQRIRTDTGLTLFLVVEAGGTLGPDGDAWENSWLYEDEASARRKYSAIDIAY